MRIYCLVIFLLINSMTAAQVWPGDTIQVHTNSGNPKYRFPQFLEYMIGKSQDQNINQKGISLLMIKQDQRWAQKWKENIPEF